MFGVASVEPIRRLSRSRAGRGPSHRAGGALELGREVSFCVCITETTRGDSQQIVLLGYYMKTGSGVARTTGGGVIRVTPPCLPPRLPPEDLSFTDPRRTCPQTRVKVIMQYVGNRVS